MNSRLDLFNARLDKCGIDLKVNSIITKGLVKDIDNKGLIETKHILIPISVDVSIGDTITIGWNTYMVLNINTNGVFSEVVAQETYHSVKVKYSWLPLMTIDIIVQGISQAIVDSTLISYDDTSVYVLMQRNDTTSQLRKGTRFFLFDVPYKVETITWENSHIMKCRCNIDAILPNDDVPNQIAYNDFIPPIIKYVINASAGVGGMIAPTGGIEVEQGKSVTFTITPNSGYEVDTVLVDGVAITITGNKFTFENVQANHTISATFKEIPIPSGEITGDYELYLGYSNEYILTGFTSPTTTWSVDNSYVQIVSSTNTTCELLCEKATQVNKTFTLSADVSGVVVTKTIKIVNL